MNCIKSMNCSILHIDIISLWFFKYWIIYFFYICKKKLLRGQFVFTLFPPHLDTLQWLIWPAWHILYLSLPLLIWAVSAGLCLLHPRWGYAGTLIKPKCAACFLDHILKRFSHLFQCFCPILYSKTQEKCNWAGEKTLTPPKKTGK